MSDLSTIEQEKLESLFKMGRGYVLNFSNSSFQNFIKKIVKIDIYDHKYNYKSGSKANRLRAFWKIETNARVAQLTTAMLAYWQNSKLLNTKKITPQEQAIYTSCQVIPTRLFSVLKNENLNKNTIPKSKKMDNQKEQSRAAISREKETKSFQAKTNHLLIIGIDEYQDKHISDLNNAVKDAIAFKGTLIKQYQFEEENTTCLFNEEATRSNILSTFDQLLNKLNKNDNLIFYYSGHGELIKTGKLENGYWLPSNATAGARYSYVSNDEIIGLYKASSAHHIFGIVDSCFSGSLFVKNRGNVENNLYYHASRWLLTAGLLEPVSDGSLGDNSPFAKTLLYFLRNNNSNSLWVSELCNQVLRSVEDNSKNQTPRGEPLQGVDHYGGQFIFYKKGYTPNEQEIEDIIQGQTKGITEEGVTTTNADQHTSKITPAFKSNNEDMPIPKTSFKDLAALKKHLKMLVSTELGEALKMYQSVLADDSRKVNDIIGQLGRYNRSSRDFNKGETTTEQRNREFARLRNALTSMIDDLEQDDIGIDYEAAQMEYKNAKGEAILLDLKQLEQKGLHQRATLLIEKINRIQAALDLEDDPTRSLKYEKQIAEAEAQLLGIKKQLG